MFVNPSEALKILKQVEPMSGRLDAGDNARYALLMTQAEVRNGLRPTDDSLINIAVDYYSKHSDNERAAWSYLYKSYVEGYQDDDSASLQSVRKANELAKDIDDNRLHYYISVCWSGILRYRFPYTEGLEKLKDALKYGELCADTAGMIWATNGIASSMIYLKEFEEARKKLYESERLASEVGLLEKYYDGINRNIIYSYYAQDSLQQALRRVDEAIDHLGISPNEGYHYMFELKRLILTKMGRFDEAQDYASVDSVSGDLRRRSSFAFDMSCIAEGMGDYATALAYHKRFYEAVDSMHSRLMDDKILELQKKYDVLEVEAASDRLRAYNRLILLIVAFLLIVILLMAMWIRRRTERRRHEMESLAYAKDKAMSESLEQMRARYDELVRNHEANEESLRCRIYETDDAIRKAVSVRNMDKEMRSAKAKEVSLSKEDIESMMMSVDVCHNGFMSRLAEEYPCMSKSDLTLCCLIKLGLKSRDVALLLGLSDSALKKRKQRLKERLELGSEVDSLDDWLLGDRQGASGCGARGAQEEVEEESAGEEQAYGEAEDDAERAEP